MNRPTLDRLDLSTLETYFETHLGDPVQATIAVPLTWPDIKNAEYEVIKRFCIAAENIGSKIIVTNNNGYPVWASDDSPVDDTRPLGRDDVDFVLSLHFESPRLTDIYSYYAIWQPVSFYFDFGYEASVEKLMTHNDALSCSSDIADAHVRSLIGAARPTPPAPFPFLFHSPAEPYFEPAITDAARLFYIGINWERLGSKKGRHHELLRLLDEDDLIDIYGPRVFLGKRPWEGFDTYRGEIPFDGTSVIRALAGSGICLAMSSHPHQQSGVMSNRLFEGLAGGCAIIANPHPIIDKYFADVVYEIDDTVSDEELFFQVKGIIEEIRRDPAAANERARIGQERMRNLFSLEKCLQALINQHETRSADFAKQIAAKGDVTVIFPFRGHRLAEAERVIDDLAAQAGITQHLVFVCDPAFADGAGKALVAGLEARFDKVTVLRDVFGRAAVEATTGQALAAALPHVTSKHFALVRTGERFFRDHFGALARRLEDDAEARVAASGKLDESYEGTQRDRFITRSVAGLGVPTELDQLLADDDFTDTGRFLFDSAVLHNLRPELLALMDGLENMALLIAAMKDGRLQQNGIASYVAVVPELEQYRPPTASLVRQRQFLRDMLKFDPEMNTLLGHLGAVGAEATKPGGDIALYHPRLFLDDMVDVREGGEGLKFLGTGFSKPEERAVWIDGLSGTLRFRLGDAQSADLDNLQLVVTLAGRASQITGRAQHCTISVNGVSLGYYALNPEPTPIVVDLPVGVARADFLRVRLVADHAEQVQSETGAVIDPRELGIFVSGFGVMRAAAAPLPELGVELDYEMRRGGSGAPLLVSGGFVDADLVWLNDGKAQFSFCLPEVDSQHRLALRMCAVDSEEEGDEISVTCALNGTPATAFRLSERMARYDIPLDPETFGPDGTCHLEILPSHAKRARGQNRLLSAALQSLKITALRQIDLGAVYGTGQGAAGLQFMRDGFSNPEIGFTWVDGDSATLEGYLDPESASGPLELYMRFGGRARDNGEGDPHEVRVFANGKDVDRVTLASDGVELRKTLPEDVFDGDETGLTLELRLVHPAEPVYSADRKQVTDPRRLGINISGFALRRPPAPMVGTEAPAES